MIGYDDLNAGQKSAIDEAISAINLADGNHITINGPAGTGKTTVTNLLIKELTRLGIHGVMLAAPTHQAKKVLTKLSGVPAMTIHSVLKISPTNYEDTQVFEQGDTPDLTQCKVLICDEASMYDRKLFHILIESIPRGCTIIALGDKAQIRPVAPNESEAQISPFFSYPKFKQIELTEVMRSNAPIIEVATSIRNGDSYYETVVDGEGVFKCDTVKDFLVEYFKIVKKPEDLMNTRMLAYTNKSVDKLNEIIRKRLYNTDDPFVVGEVIVLQEPLTKRVSLPDGKSATETIFNTGELVKIKAISYNTQTPKIYGLPTNGVNFQYASLDVIAIEDNELGKREEATIKIIFDPEDQENFNYFLKSATSDIRASSQKGMWPRWWKLKNDFIKVKPLPCSTIHKSQGITVDNCFVFTSCSYKSDVELQQQLLYVAFTRARKNVFYI